MLPNYSIKDLEKERICPRCGKDIWREHDGLTYCVNCDFWVEGQMSLMGESPQKENKMCESIERELTDNVFRIKTEVTGGESNYPDADKFETIRNVIENVDRGDIQKITITRMERLEAQGTD